MRLKKRHRGIWIVSVLVLALITLWSCAKAPINQEVKRGVAYKDGKFVSPWGQIDKPFSDFLRWQFTREQPQWPEWVDHVGGVSLSEVSDNDVAVTYINHATMLIRMNGVNMLTDPIYSERASPVGFLGPKRVHAPGIAFDALPRIDVVMISHNHYDHLDLPTLKKLAERDQPQFLVGLGNEELLRGEDIERVRPLDWGESVFLRGVKISFVPSQHWSARGVLDHHKTLWGSYVINDKIHRVYFAGDTGYTEHFRHIGESYGPFDIALLPIGAYEPRWFMKEQHLNPDEAVKAQIDLRAQVSIAMHFDTFQLADEAYGAAGPQFLHIASQFSDDNFRALVLQPGESYYTPSTP